MVATDRRRRLIGLTSSVVVLKPLLGFARAHGVDTAALLTDLGLQLPELDDIDRRISELDKERLWQEAAMRARDAAFGLHVAEWAAVGAFDVLDYALCYSSTLGDALGRILRFHRVLSDAWALDLKFRGGVAQLAFDSADLTLPTSKADAGLVAMLDRHMRIYSSGCHTPTNSFRRFIARWPTRSEVADRPWLLLLARCAHRPGRFNDVCSTAARAVDAWSTTSGVSSPSDSLGRISSP